MGNLLPKKEDRITIFAALSCSFVIFHVNTYTKEYTVLSPDNFYFAAERILMVKKAKKHNTIFDDVSRTMVQKMPHLLIPVINEVFGTNYSYDVPFEQLRNEHAELFGKVITDSIIKIDSHIYHIECQSTDDNTMVLRMIEYDFAIALEDAFLKGRPYEMTFPESCVLYLRKGNETKRNLRIKVNLPDGQYFFYNARAINLQNYSCDDIFEKRLLFFLPYYIMRYEDELPTIYEDENKMNSILLEYENICKKLVAELSDKDKTLLYTDLMNLILKITDYVIKSDTMKKRLGDVMGGKVLELESERLQKLAKNNTLFNLVKNGKLSISDAADELSISNKEFLDNMKKAGYDISSLSKNS